MNPPYLDKCPFVPVNLTALALLIPTLIYTIYINVFTQHPQHLNPFGIYIYQYIPTKREATIVSAKSYQPTAISNLIIVDEDLLGAYTRLRLMRLIAFTGAICVQIYYIMDMKVSLQSCVVLERAPFWFAVRSYPFIYIIRYIKYILKENSSSYFRI